MSKNKSTEQKSNRIISIRRGMLTLIGVVLIATTALATVAVTRLTSHPTETNSATANPSSPLAEKIEAGIPAPHAQQGGRDELKIEISTNGFTPNEVTHSSGVFAIAVENLDIAGEYVLRLKTADGTLLKEVSVQKGSTSWSVELAPGTYTLTEASHQTWICNLIVQ